jgi:hypothetical protein
VLCNRCYCEFLVNPPKKSPKRAKVIEEVGMPDSRLQQEEVSVSLSDTIKLLGRFLYEREHVEKEHTIYKFDEMRESLEEREPRLKDFFDQLYLAARPHERSNQTMDRMKRIMLVVCYLLASLNNTKINSFKFALAYYLDSAGTTNEGLNTLANLGVSTTARAVDRQKKKKSDTHGQYVENVLEQCSQNAFVINIDDYHNIHVQRRPNSTETSSAAHMATILANPCPMQAISWHGALNPKVVDSELIAKHLDRRFIVNLGVSYYDRMKDCMTKEYSDEDVIDRLTLHSYDDRLKANTSYRHIQNSILFDFIESKLKGVDGYMNALQIIHDQEPMQVYLSKYVVPVVADWPGQFFIRKAIAQRFLVKNENIPEYITSFLPVMGPLHVSLNARELVFLKNSFLFNDIYKGIFGSRKTLGKKPRPWRIDLLLHIVRMAWHSIVDDVYLKFGHTCKNIEFLYLTDLLSNLIPLVLDVYAVHHRGGDWPAYEEACMRCWTDLFLRFDRRNYKRAPLMFFSDVFYWMEIGHPMVSMITNYLASLSDAPVEIAHSIIRRRTVNFSGAQQLRKQAHFIFQQRHDNAFQENFVQSVKYPNAPKQVQVLSQKCAIWLLEAFGKIYQMQDQCSFIVESSSDGINTYKLASLGYQITDRHLPRGFVTSKKPDTSTLCDAMHCISTNTNDSFAGSILSCGHGYHSHCLKTCQFKCLICLDYLQKEVKKNVDALIVSITKRAAENECIENSNPVEDDLSDADEVRDDMEVTAGLLENAKKAFIQL